MTDADHLQPMNKLDRFRHGERPSIPTEAPAKFREAALYDADDALRTALELSIELRQPLLLTGEPGCGKTAAAYWAAWHLGLAPKDVYHTQVRSSSTAEQLKYEFDNIGYLRDSQVAASAGKQWSPEEALRMKAQCVHPGPLWRAFEGARERSIVLLLDEVDKAPRDLPNDLLHEFDQLEFDVPEWEVEGKARVISARRGGAALDGVAPFILIVFTSNGERRLPDAFLRRCVHHHLAFDEARMLEIVLHRAKSEQDLTRLSKDFVEHALKRFLVLKSQPDLNHRPGLAEFLVWLRVIARAGNLDANALSSLPVSKLPYMGLLIKDPDDRKRLAPSGR